MNLKLRASSLVIVAAFIGARFFVILCEPPKVPWGGHTNLLIPKRQGRRIQGGFRGNQLHVGQSNPRDPRDRIGGLARGREAQVTRAPAPRRLAT